MMAANDPGGPQAGQTLPGPVGSGERVPPRTSVATAGGSTPCGSGCRRLLFDCVEYLRRGPRLVTSPVGRNSTVTVIILLSQHHNDRTIVFYDRIFYSFRL